MTVRRFDARDVAVGLAAPVLAIVFAAALASLVLVVAGDPVWSTYRLLVDYGQQPRSLTLVLNAATIYYLSAVAVAIGFRMNLFNIGVDGQYRLAAMTAAYVGGTLSLPPGLHQVVIVLTAVAVGAMWAGIAGLLKATRGVSEVISTIMLNAIATGVVAFFLRSVAVPVAGSNNIGTPPIPESGRIGGLALVPGSTLEVFGFLPVAVLVGIGYWYVLGRTRFGFDLRATGRSSTAAVASGVDVKKMVVTTMLLSGGVAGLVGMPQLLGASYTYSLDFPAGLGFTGIAIALLGRNSPIGIAFGALLWAYLDVSSVILDVEGISREIVTIVQGTIVLSVVVAYELVRRYRLRAEQRRVARELGEQSESEQVAA
jgi:general nucleoside transport system permease protein